MFFNFWALFLKMYIFEVAKIYLTKYQVANQLNFSVVVCVCKVHVFNETFFHLKHFSLIIEKMSFTYIYSNSC